jgi:hypothetical protein
MDGHVAKQQDNIFFFHARNHLHYIEREARIFLGKSKPLSVLLGDISSEI